MLVYVLDLSFTYERKHANFVFHQVLILLQYFLFLVTFWGIHIVIFPYFVQSL
jgi:hypothetical protein